MMHTWLTNRCQLLLDTLIIMETEATSDLQNREWHGDPLSNRDPAITPLRHWSSVYPTPHLNTSILIQDECSKSIQDLSPSCIYTAQVQLSHAPIPPAGTACPGLAAPSNRDTLLGCLGSRKGKKKKSTYSRSCRKERLNLEEVSSQVVLKLHPSKVPAHFSTSVNENSAPTPLSHSATSFQTAIKLLGAVPPLRSCMKRKQPNFPAPWSLQAYEPYSLLVKHKNLLPLPTSPSPPTRQQQITELSRGKQNAASCATLREKFLPRLE